MLVKGSEEKGCAVISDVWRWSDVVSSELNLITSVGILNWFKKKKLYRSAWNSDFFSQEVIWR